MLYVGCFVSRSNSIVKVLTIIGWRRELLNYSGSQLAPLGTLHAQRASVLVKFSPRRASGRSRSDTNSHRKTSRELNHPRTWWKPTTSTAPQRMEKTFETQFKLYHLADQHAIMFVATFFFKCIHPFLLHSCSASLLFRARYRVWCANYPFDIHIDIELKWSAKRRFASLLWGNWKRMNKHDGNKRINRTIQPSCFLRHRNSLL